MNGLRVSVVLAIIVLANLSGCTRYYWSKPGSTSEQFDRDSRQCAQEAMRRGQFGPESAYRACLTARGYVREKQADPPPPGSHRGLEDEDQFPGSGN